MTEISLKAEEVFHIFNWPITNTLILSTMVVVFLVAASLAWKKKISVLPGRVQNVIEIVIEAILKLMEQVLGNPKKAEKYLPLVASIFIFILTANWFGILPGLNAVGIKEDGVFFPLLRSPASDLNFTLGLALFSVITVNFLAVLTLGFRVHFSKFFNFQNPIKFFVGILEFISEFAKIISFSFRLFGNVFAGEVLLIIVAFLVPYIVPLPFLFLEIFVGFIQAFIFAMLTLVFIAISTAEVEH